MTQTKKLVYGTQRGLNRQIELHEAKGWVPSGSFAIPRGRTGRMTYIANLEKGKP